MDNIKSKVIIIDNNNSNGVYLSVCCHAVMPHAAITWLRISEETENPSGVFIEGVNFKAVSSVEDAADIVEQETSTTAELIVFYNLRLGHYQGTVKRAIRSPITNVVKQLVASHRRILVNVHSSEIPTRELAETIDPLFKTKPREARVICHHLITGSQPHTILEIVQETLIEWRRRNPENGIKRMEAVS